MKKEKIFKIGVIVFILLMVIGIVVYKKSMETKEIKLKNITNENKVNTMVSVDSNKEEILPTLLEFGSTTCFPCQTMEPIISSIREKYEGKLNVNFIDVYKDSKMPQKYNISLIPTQIFLDEDQNVLYRHEGILYEDEIISKLKEMGIE